MDSGSQNFRFFQILFDRRSYKNITFLENLYIDGTKYIVTLGQKCNHQEVRVNGKEYRNNLGIFDVKSDNQYLRFYYHDDGMLDALRCSQKSATNSEATSPITETSTTGAQN